MKYIIVGLAIFIASLSANAQDNTIDQVIRGTVDMSKQFTKGYQKGQGHIGDKLIEGMLEAVTPEANESCRRIQRDAVKFILDPNQTRSEQHLDNMMRHATEAAGGAPDEFPGGASKLSRGKVGRLQLASKQRFDEERVRYILADITLGNVAGFYRSHDSANDLEAIARWDAGIRVANIERFERKIVERKGWQIVYAGSTRSIDGMDVILTSGTRTQATVGPAHGVEKRPIIISVSPRNTVMLDPEKEGGHGLRISDKLTPGKTYRITAQINGDSGGPTRSVFLWQGGFRDRTGKNRNAEYFSIRAGETYLYKYPDNGSRSGPVLFVFFADAENANDNSARGRLTFEEE